MDKFPWRNKIRTKPPHCRNRSNDLALSTDATTDGVQLKMTAKENLSRPNFSSAIKQICFLLKMRYFFLKIKNSKRYSIEKMNGWCLSRLSNGICVMSIGKKHFWKFFTAIFLFFFHYPWSVFDINEDWLIPWQK